MKKILKVLKKIERMINKVRRPVTMGVRALIIKDNMIYLVKHSYENFWYIPGGGVKKGETFEDGMKRELSEEIGLKVKDMKLFGVYNNFYEYKNDSIVIFLVTDFEFIEQNKNSIEIEDRGFFRIEELPENISPGSKRRIMELIKGEGPYYGKW